MCIFGVCPTTSAEKCAQIESYGIDSEELAFVAVAGGGGGGGGSS